MPLRGVARYQTLFSKSAQFAVLEHSARRLFRRFQRNEHQRFHFFACQFLAFVGCVIVLLHNAHRLCHGVLFPFDCQFRLVEMRAHVQRLFEQAHIFIQGAKEGFNFPGDMYRASHPRRGVLRRTNRRLS